MLSYLGRSGDARWFAMNTFSGRGQPTIPSNVTYGDRPTTTVVLGTQTLVLQDAFDHARYFQNTDARGVRDELTNSSMANSVPLPPDICSSDYDNRTHGERMAVLLDASRRQYLANAWKYMKDGDFLRGKSLFDNALLLDRDAAEPLIGKLLCASAKQEIRTASFYLATLAKREDLFRYQYALSEVYPNADQADIVIAWITSAVSSSPDIDSAAALQVYLLWLDNRDSAALAAAQRLREAFRSSPYANFADLIQTQMRANEESTSPRKAQQE